MNKEELNKFNAAMQTGDKETIIQAIKNCNKLCQPSKNSFIATLNADFAENVGPVASKATASVLENK